MPVFDALRRCFGRTGAVPVWQRPLLEAAELAALDAHVRFRPVPLVAFSRQVRHPLIGERPSSLRGQGYEFEENRIYRPGDEPRLLNWRLYARSGVLHSKVFSEERRPQAVLLLDRRAPMRFATRGRIKAALAAALAACHAFDARRQALATGALVLDDSPQWLAPRAGDAGLHALLQAFNAPCPPEDFEAGGPVLAEALDMLGQRLPAGAFIGIFSDFLDFDEAAAGALQRLSECHHLRAVQVLDVVERALPPTAEIHFQAGSGQLSLAPGDARLRARYRQGFDAAQAALKAWLGRAGVSLSVCDTAQSVQDCLEALDAG